VPIGLLASCRALIVPGKEDFGVAPIEAMATGRPVIAYGAGGVPESVVDGVTGVLFAEQSAACLEDAVERCLTMTFSKVELHRHAQGFDVSCFKQGLEAVAVAAWQERANLV